MSEREHHDVVVVGSGHGGAHLAATLRARKFAGSIAIVTAEAELPYERPPLSKEFLSGERTFQRILLRPEAFWAQRDISLKCGNAVVAVDAAERTVRLEDGRTIQYGKLVWAAGGSPRSLTCSGAWLQGVHTLRSAADVGLLRQQLASTRHVAIVGGGYIGLEAAASLSKLGKQVTVIETLDRVLARVSGEPLSRFYEVQHRAHGVNLRLGCRIECVEGEGGRVTGLRLQDGSVLATDLVIVGIGITPVCEPLLAAGACGGNGVAVDEYCRTSLRDIYAIGDCALHFNSFAGGAAVRLESVQNASDMAITAAKAITGELQPYRAVPWFWSNQYDLLLQTVGISLGHDDLVVRGPTPEGGFAVVYLRNKRVIALDCVNSSKDFLQGRTLIQLNVPVLREALADTTIPLKDLILGRAAHEAVPG